MTQSRIMTASVTARYCNTPDTRAEVSCTCLHGLHFFFIFMPWLKREKSLSVQPVARRPCNGHEWNTLQAAAQPKALSRSNPRVSVPAGNRPVPLQDVAETGHHPYPSGIASLDRVLGKGLVPGAAILIGGEPGIGKSTLLLQVAGLVAAQGGRVLYASGEESLPQIKARGQRLGMLHDNLLAMSTSSVDEVIAALELAPPRLLVVDSVQTMSSVDAEGLPGNVNQVRAVSMALLEACRRLGVTLVLVGHVTKDGVLAGPRLLEHMVDTVISLEGDRRQMFRLLRVFKNRFGPNEELPHGGPGHGSGG